MFYYVTFYIQLAHTNLLVEGITAYSFTYRNKRKVERSETLLLDDKLPKINTRCEASAPAKQGNTSSLAKCIKY